MILKTLWTRFLHILLEAAKYLCWFLIKCYQVILAPHMAGACRFHPTCSCYAEESFKTYPVAVALQLTMKRLAKCRPGGPAGWDPVPSPRSLT